MNRSLLAFGMALALAGCAEMTTTGGAQTPVIAPIPTQTFNDKEAIALRLVITLRTTATQLMTAGKITIEQDVLIQKQLDLAVDGLRVARSLYASKPVEAAAQLAASLAEIDALKPQLGVK